MLIAMAGHVDHGKTSLIRALTGIDTDRLPAEKARGMTIDLGFAHASLPSGETIGFVDVPGHERFLSNMLAGVLAIDSVLLVVAADDGPMPQTHEHLSILRMIGLRDLAAAITKLDRVDATRSGSVSDAVRQVTEQAGFRGAPLFPVSSQDGSGIAVLRRYLQEKAAHWQPPPVGGGFRMAIDRVFVMPGAGLVVTGTVTSGQASVGDRLLVSPSRLAARIRGIQVHHAATATARAGERCALAITGPQLERGKLRRGDWLVEPRLHAPTERLDVLLRSSEDRPLRHTARVHAHLGAAAIGGKVLSFSSADLPAGSEDFASVRLDRPCAALFGDRIVLREDATGRVVAGGRVVDPFPPMRRQPRAQRLVSLTAQAALDVHDSLAALLAAEGSVDLARFAVARNIAAEAVDSLAAGVAADRIGRAGRPILVSRETRRAHAATLLQRLAAWHERHADLPGAGKPAVLGFLPTVPSEIGEAVLMDLLADGRLVRHGATWRLPDHVPVLPAADQASWSRIEPMLEAAGLRPPRLRELAEALQASPAETDQLLIRLEHFGHVLRVAPNRCFLPRTLVHLAALAENLAAESEADGFTAAIFNQRTGVGRNLTIEVLEYLDRAGVTQRNGDIRHVLRPGSEVF